MKYKIVGLTLALSGLIAVAQVPPMKPLVPATQKTAQLPTYRSVAQSASVAPKKAQTFNLSGVLAMFSMLSDVRETLESSGTSIIDEINAGKDVCQIIDEHRAALQKYGEQIRFAISALDEQIKNKDLKKMVDDFFEDKDKVVKDAFDGFLDHIEQKPYKKILGAKVSGTLHKIVKSLDTEATIFMTLLHVLITEMITELKDSKSEINRFLNCLYNVAKKA